MKKQRKASRDDAVLSNNLANIIQGNTAEKKLKKAMTKDFKEQAGRKSSTIFTAKNRSPAIISNSQLAHANKAIQDDKKEEDGKKWLQEDALTPFKELFNSNIAVLMRKLNKSIVPLNVAGHLLNYVGNHILNYAYLSN